MRSLSAAQFTDFTSSVRQDMIILFGLLLCSVDTNSLEDNGVVPRISSFHIQSNIQYRYARTVVSSRVANPASIPQDTTFSMVLPETAFISGFFMEVDGEVFDAYVKEAEDAKKTYDEAVQEGKTAGHIALSARDSNRFTVSMNVEPQKEVTFTLIYEELLRRNLGLYKHIITLDPGQVVQDLSVDVHIEESNDIIHLRVPQLQVRKEMDANSSKEDYNSLASIQRPNNHSAVIKFAPNVGEQENMSKEGIKGQLIVQYDVDRTSRPQQLLMSNGYFAHYFAPDNLTALSKHVVFVLDKSGSMGGRKLAQLKEAMNTILDDLRIGDYFSLISFSSDVEIFRYSDKAEWTSSVDEKKWKHFVVEANRQHITQAKEAVAKLDATGGTNIHKAMKVSTNVALLGEKLKEKYSGAVKPESIIIFLTDGEPTNGETNLNKIIIDTTKWNRRCKASLFSLALGFMADLDFLKKLSLRNSGVAIKIYDATDTALQLRDFYQQVASPLLADVTFTYHPEQEELISLTKHHFDNFYRGSEIVVAGHMEEPIPTHDFSYEVTGRASYGIDKFGAEQPVIIVEHGLSHQPSFMEKLWAYLKVQQLLDEEKSNFGKSAEEKRREAVKLALKYSFVTPVTSLVVVRPDTTDVKADIAPADQETSKWCEHCRSTDRSGHYGGAAAMYGDCTSIRSTVFIAITHLVYHIVLKHY